MRAVRFRLGGDRARLNLGSWRGDPMSCRVGEGCRKTSYVRRGGEVTNVREVVVMSWDT